MKVQRYYTVVKKTVTEFDGEIQRLLAEGYQPFGSPYISPTDEYHQAMVEYGSLEDQPPKTPIPISS